MPRRIPKYRCFKPRNLGLVVIDGKQHYLGRYGSPESVAEYNRLVQEWLARGDEPRASVVDRPSGSVLTVNELILVFLTHHGKNYYRHADGTPTGEYDNFKESLKPLKSLFGRSPTSDFTPSS